MPRGGPGSASTVRLPANWPRTEDHIVWSWAGGRWWRVDGGPSRDAMWDSCIARLHATERGTLGDRRLGTKPHAPVPGARFVITYRNGDPQTDWETIHGSEVAS